MANSKKTTNKYMNKVFKRIKKNTRGSFITREILKQILFLLDVAVALIYLTSVYSFKAVKGLIRLYVAHKNKVADAKVQAKIDESSNIIRFEDLKKKKEA